jgi:hypothetical protein
MFYWRKTGRRRVELALFAIRTAMHGENPTI